LPARKLWIAFARKPSGRLVVDEGARRALIERGTSLLPAGVREVVGGFLEDDAVEVSGPDGIVFAKGIVRVGAARSAEWLGRRTSELPADLPDEVIHRDDLVLLTDD
jgi:glutamate 5-kinase